MERTNNFNFFKKKKNNYKSSNYISNQNATSQIEVNQNQNKPQNINFNRLQNTNINRNQALDFNRNKIKNNYPQTSKNRNYNYSLVQNIDKIEHQASDIVSFHAQITNKDNLLNKDDSLIKVQDELVRDTKPISQLTPIKSDFSISYKDKAYTYVIPENILKKEKQNLPFWLQPIHVRLIPNDSSTFDFCNEVFARLSETGARIEINNNPDNIAKKIKNAETDKIPFVIVIGPKEKSIHKFIVRSIDGTQKLLSVGAFFHILEEQLENKPKSKIN